MEIWKLAKCEQKYNKMRKGKSITRFEYIEFECEKLIYFIFVVMYELLWVF